MISSSSSLPPPPSLLFFFFKNQDPVERPLFLSSWLWAAGKWFSMVLAPPSKETPLEAKTVNMASAAVWDLLKRQVKPFLFPNIKIKILSRLPQTKGGWGPEDHPPSCICEGRNAKMVPGPEGTRLWLPGLQQEGWDGPHFQTWTGPAAERGQGYGTASLTA